MRVSDQAHCGLCWSSVAFSWIVPQRPAEVVMKLWFVSERHGFPGYSALPQEITKESVHSRAFALIMFACQPSSKLDTPSHSLSVGENPTLLGKF